jgi:fatty-acyl-CoA synthase
MGLTDAIRREYIYISSIARTLWLLRLVKPHSTRTIVDIVEAQAKKRPDAVAIYCLDQAMSYAQLDARANRYANWALAQGIGRGDAVALLMENRPDYICAWLGMFKVGAQVALINTNLQGATWPIRFPSPPPSTPLSAPSWRRISKPRRLRMRRNFGPKAKMEI